MSKVSSPQQAHLQALPVNFQLYMLIATPYQVKDDGLINSSSLTGSVFVRVKVTSDDKIPSLMGEHPSHITGESSLTSSNFQPISVESSLTCHNFSPVTDNSSLMGSNLRTIIDVKSRVMILNFKCAPKKNLKNLNFTSYPFYTWWHVTTHNSTFF